MHALMERVVIGPNGADICMRVEGLAGLVRDISAMAPAARIRDMAAFTLCGAASLLR